MLRSEHEVKNYAEIRAFLERSSVIRVAFNTETAPYIVPLTYGFDYKDNENKLTFYFHGAAKGLKLDLAQKNSNVGIEIDNAIELKPAEIGRAHV